MDMTGHRGSPFKGPFRGPYRPEIGKNLRKMWEQLTGKYLQNDFFNRVLDPETGLDRFLLQNAAQITSQNSISIFLDHIRARFDVFLDFSTISEANSAILSFS